MEQLSLASAQEPTSREPQEARAAPLLEDVKTLAVGAAVVLAMMVTGLHGGPDTRAADPAVSEAASTLPWVEIRHAATSLIDHTRTTVDHLLHHGHRAVGSG